jgi:iron(III) transport system substrate-binding protein
MFKLSLNRKFLSTIGKTLMLVSFLFVVLQTPKLNAQSIVEKAKKEGKVTFYSSLRMYDHQAVGDAFMKKYPFIKYEPRRVGSSSRSLEKCIMERQGGLRIADALQINGSDVNLFIKEGLLQKHISPEDFLDPKWKGKIALADSETEWYMGMMQFMGREKALRFMKRLADQIKIYSGKTLSMQLVAAGEFPIAKGILHRYLAMKKKGAPIQTVTLPTPTLAGMRVIALHADAPHPNAAKLFIDFMLSKEGQETLVDISYHPIRLDVKVDPVLEKVMQNWYGINPIPAVEMAASMKEFQKVVLKR